jgi:hypothetical protein
MAQSRHGSAGELLAWRPIMWDTRALGGVSGGVDHTGPYATERSVQTYNENSDAILESASRRKTLKWHYIRIAREATRSTGTPSSGAGRVRRPSLVVAFTLGSRASALLVGPVLGVLGVRVVGARVGVACAVGADVLRLVLVPSPLSAKIFTRAFLPSHFT